MTVAYVQPLYINPVESTFAVERPNLYSERNLPKIPITSAQECLEFIQHNREWFEYELTLARAHREAGNRDFAAMYLNGLQHWREGIEFWKNEMYKFLPKMLG